MNIVLLLNLYRRGNYVFHILLVMVLNTTHIWYQKHWQRVHGMHF